MNGSILSDIKKLLGIDDSYTNFDQDIILHINSVFLILNQLGVGPEKPYSIEDESDNWSDFTDDYENLQAIKSYIYLKVRLMFDPPTVGGHIDALKELIREYECRLNYAVDPGSK